MNLTERFSVRTIDSLPFAQVRNETGAEETLHLDLYLPEDAGAEPVPCVFWFHGGGFRPGNDRHQVYVPRFARAFAARGLAGIAPDYRIRQNPPDDYPGTITDAVNDARQALDWLCMHGAEYGLDAHRFAVAGGSAGGMLVLNWVHHPAQPVGKTDGLAAVIDLWGSPPAGARQFSAVQPGSPRTFIVHGDADRLVPYAASSALAAELEEAGVPVHLLTLPGAPHTPLMHFDHIVDELSLFLNQAF
jgi:acetyl esterase/lipase